MRIRKTEKKYTFLLDFYVDESKYSYTIEVSFHKRNFFTSYTQIPETGKTETATKNSREKKRDGELWQRRKKKYQQQTKTKIK